MSDFVPILPSSAQAAANQLNRDCACMSVDRAALQNALEAGGGVDYGELVASRPHLFSDTVVFASAACLAHMAAIVQAIESVIALPAYHARVLADAPPIVHHTVAARGVFLGYDFHLDSSGPRLIEINTNAGGGLLNAHLAAAQRACCGPVSNWLPKAGTALEERYIAMFREEWGLARGDRPLRRIAIVDETPAEQYLAPEFELFRQLFEAHGISATIAAPEELSWDGAFLRCRGDVIDLVYNRLTDFLLDEAANAPLRQAYLADGVVLTPHPQAHALYADKRNLTVLSDPHALRALGVSQATQEVLLSGIPRTVLVEPAAAGQFWAERKQWFFKPAVGFGSRAAYRGDKITKRVFEEILAGDYIAQAIVPPSERQIQGAGGAQALKVDFRNYVYHGDVQLVSARLYQGQTTNFRTPGGGFASVLSVPQ